MRLLVITPFYAPDIGPSAPLFTLLGEALVKRGHQVRVVSAVPHYPSGRVPAGYRGLRIRRSVEGGVEVVRVPVPSLDRTRFTNRLLQFICFQAGSTFASLIHKYDVVLMTNPAIETWLPAIWHAVVRGKPMIYSVFDVYPDVGIKLGIFRSAWVIKTVALLERMCLKPAAAVHIISDNFRPGLNALGVPDAKMSFIPLWVDTDLVRPLPHDNEFSRQHGLAGKFVVLYAGNIGLSQGLEWVLDAAGRLAARDDIQFVLVGDGSGREALQAQAQQRGLANVQFIPFQPRERLPQVLASAHVSLIILKRGIGSDSLPSKTYSILASGRPVIASVDEQSELQRLIEIARAGICIPPEAPDRLAETILQLKNNAEICTQLGSSGREYLEKAHSVANAVERFEKLFGRLAQS